MPFNFDCLNQDTSKPTPHRGEWRNCVVGTPGARSFYCVILKTPSENDGLMCTHATLQGAAKKSSHWSCCGSTEETSVNCSKPSVGGRAAPTKSSTVSGSSSKPKGGSASKRVDSSASRGEHEFHEDVTTLCTRCGQCTGFGPLCVNAAQHQADELTGNSFGNNGGSCGCGPGLSGCTHCGMCRQCARSASCSGPGNQGSRSNSSDMDIVSFGEHVMALSPSTSPATVPSTASSGASTSAGPFSGASLLGNLPVLPSLRRLHQHHQQLQHMQQQQAQVDAHINSESPFQVGARVSMAASALRRSPTSTSGSPGDQSSSVTGVVCRVHDHGRVDVRLDATNAIEERVMVVRLTLLDPPRPSSAINSASATPSESGSNSGRLSSRSSLARSFFESMLAHSDRSRSNSTSANDSGTNTSRSTSYYRGHAGGAGRELNNNVNSSEERSGSSLSRGVGGLLFGGTGGSSNRERERTDSAREKARFIQSFEDGKEIKTVALFARCLNNILPGIPLLGAHSKTSQGGGSTLSDAAQYPPHCGVMVCKCAHALGRLQWPLDNSYMHLTGKPLTGKLVAKLRTVCGRVLLVGLLWAAL
jgi:hypothetical protein